MNAPVPFGHYETTVRLGLLAGAKLLDADLDRLNGWLRFGKSMLEASSLCGDKRVFDQWLREQAFEVGGRPVTAAERRAAIWGA